MNFAPPVCYFDLITVSQILGGETLAESSRNNQLNFCTYAHDGTVSASGYDFIIKKGKDPKASTDCISSPNLTLVTATPIGCIAVDATTPRSEAVDLIIDTRTSTYVSLLVAYVGPGAEMPVVPVALRTNLLNATKAAELYIEAHGM